MGRNENYSYVAVTAHDMNNKKDSTLIFVRKDFVKEYRLGEKSIVELVNGVYSFRNVPIPVCNDQVARVIDSSLLKTKIVFSKTIFVDSMLVHHYKCQPDSSYGGCFNEQDLVIKKLLQIGDTVSFSPQIHGADDREMVGFELKYPLMYEVKKDSLPTVKKGIPTKKSKPSRTLIFWQKKAAFWKAKAEKAEQKKTR